MSFSYQEAATILKQSDLLYTEAQILPHIKSIASTIEKEIVGDIPLFLIVMNGAIFFFTELLKHIKSPILFDYIHVSRYNNTNVGNKNLSWYYKPEIKNIQGKNVYIIDDILDEGYTLNAICSFLQEAGAKTYKIAVLVDKNLGYTKSVASDFVALSAPNKFLFGYGMDIFGLHRQLPDIYAYNGGTPYISMT